MKNLNKITDFLFSRFKPYRKFSGGIWHKNRYIFDAGRLVIFSWNRKAIGDKQYSRYVGFEDYTETIQERRQRIIKKVV